jgi:hypothetical protein
MEQKHGEEWEEQESGDRWDDGRTTDTQLHTGCCAAYLTTASEDLQTNAVQVEDGAWLWCTQHHSVLIVSLVLHALHGHPKGGRAVSVRKCHPRVHTVALQEAIASYLKVEMRESAHRRTAERYWVTTLHLVEGERHNKTQQNE